MRFSFIIPVYNAPAVNECTESLLEGLSADDEIILIDDGSEKFIADLCDRIAARDSRIRVIHQRNQGASAARNRGILESRGSLLMFADADDRVGPEIISQASAVFSQPQPPDLLIFEHTAAFYDHGVCTRQEIRRLPAEGMITVQESAARLQDFFVCNALSPLWNKVFRKDILRQAGLLLNTSMTVYEDLEFTLRYLAHCRNLYCLQETGYLYRVEEKKNNSGRRLRNIQDIGEILLPLSDALGEMGSVFGGTENRTYSKQKDRVMQKLFLILAREKLSVTGYSRIKDQCRKMRRLLREAGIRRNGIMSPGEAMLVSRIENNKVLRIWLERRYAAVRHSAAVLIKGMGVRIRGRQQCKACACMNTGVRKQNKHEH